MIEAILIWAIASLIFVNKFDYPVQNCLDFFFVMSAVGLLIRDKRRVREGVGRVLIKWAESLNKKKKEE